MNFTKESVIFCKEKETNIFDKGLLFKLLKKIFYRIINEE